MEHVKDMVELIKNFTKEERKLFDDNLAYHDVSQHKPLARKQTDFIEAVFTATNMTILPNQSVDVKSIPFIKGYGRKLFDEKLTTVETFIIKSSAKGLKYIDQLEVTKKVVLLLANHMRKNRMICDAKTLLDNINLMAEAVDIQFPNYAESGLLHVLARPTDLHMGQKPIRAKVF